MKKKILLLFILLILVPNIVHADIGPKPSLIIEVLGLDGYYLDLLVQVEAEHSWLEITEEAKEDLATLANYEDEEGYHPALLKGTKVPIWGDIVGEKIEDGRYIHEFSYLGVPDHFKLAILTQDDRLIISPEVDRKHFQSEMTWDLRGLEADKVINLNQGQVRETFPAAFIARGFGLRIILTLLIEGIVGYLFGFRSRKSMKLIAKTNLKTQFILNLGIYTSNLYGGMLLALLLLMLMEIGILIYETKVYAEKLVEGKRSRKIIYGVLANLLSFGLGFILVTRFEI